MSFIAAATLVDQVRNTAGFLWPTLPEPEGGQLVSLHGGPRGFLRILSAAASRPPAEQELADYFALCVASHHATVATFVPTDVDTKIRGLLWRETKDRQVLRAMADVALSMHGWELSPISRRTTLVDGFGAVSGHDGEWLSVAIGAYGRLRAMDDREYAGMIEAAIDAEFQREVAAFERMLLTPGCERQTLELAMSIAHNQGDVNQGVSFWSGSKRFEPQQRFVADRRYQCAARMYKELLASEGHRHYPLRAVRPLRRDASLLLPLCPFLEEWGAAVVTSPLLTVSELAEVVDALVRGCRKVAGQEGYYRALAGMREASRGRFDAAVEQLPNAARREWREPEMQKRVAVGRESFASRYRKRVVAARDQFRNAKA